MTTSSYKINAQKSTERPKNEIQTTKTFFKITHQT